MCSSAAWKSKVFLLLLLIVLVHLKPKLFVKHFIDTVIHVSMKYIIMSITQNESFTMWHGDVIKLDD